MKYVLYPHGGSGNHGCEAIVRATKIILGEEIHLFSTRIKEDMKYGLGSVCKTIQYPIAPIKKNISYLKALLRNKILREKDAFDILAFNNVIQASKQADFFLSIGGDNYCYGVPEYIMTVNRALKKCHTPMILWGCSIEPDSMKDSLLEDLKLYDHIIARESITFNALKDKGFTNISLIPDPAFILPVGKPILPEGFEEGNTVGINFSPMVTAFAGERAGILLQNYIEVIKWILNSTDMKVALIPHVVWEHNDDRKAFEQISQHFTNEERILTVLDQNAEQLKGIISKCKFLITARTHASIAGYSTGVPTLVLGYSVKARGIARDIFGIEEGYVIPVQNVMSNMAVLHSFINLFKNEKIIQSNLKQKMTNYSKKCFAMKEVVNSILKLRE